MPEPNVQNDLRVSWGRTILVLLTLGAALLRLYQLNSGMWFDEIVTLVTSVRRPLGEILTTFPSNNAHPLYSAVAHLSVTVFGESAWSLRLPAALFGVASIPLMYRLATNVTTRFEALLTAAILTVSYHHVWFSQNARGYTALLFWVLLTTHFLIQWRQKGTNASLAAYAVAAALGAYTHLTMVFVVVSHAIVCAWISFVGERAGRSVGGRIRLAATFISSGLLTIVLYAPMLVNMHKFFTTSIPTKRVATPLWALQEAIRGLDTGGVSQLWIVVVGGCIFATGIASYARRSMYLPFLFFLSAPVTLGVATAMGRPVFPRFLFFLVGFGLLTLLRGSGAIGEWLAARCGKEGWAPAAGMLMAALTALAAVAASIESLPYGYRYPKQDYASALAYVQQRCADDPVAVVGEAASMPFLVFFGQPWAHVANANELLGLRDPRRDLWLIYTFPMYLEANQPELWKLIQTECQPMRSFAGTIAGGNIEVRRWSAAEGSPHDETRSTVE